jgi:hypothetical protein
MELGGGAAVIQQDALGPGAFDVFSGGEVIAHIPDVGRHAFGVAVDQMKTFALVTEAGSPYAGGGFLSTHIQQGKPGRMGF